MTHTTPVEHPVDPALDEEGLASFLEGDAIDPSGAVWSWVDPRRSGYFYPEAAGLHLAALGRNDDVAVWLAGSRDVDGGVGRDGHRYTFDTAMALNGLLTHRANGGEVARGVFGDMFDFLSANIRARRASTAPSPPERWSTKYAPHLLKTAIAIHRYGAIFEDSRAREVCAQLRDDFAPVLGSIALALGGDGAGDRHYVHAACYAFEGALYLDAVGDSSYEALCREAGAGLARLQRNDGALPAFTTGEGARADATAQAVRIWCAVGRDAFADSIRRALAWLSSCQHPSGGVVYEPGSDHVNTWASIFALQALRWSKRGADIEAIA